MTERMEARLRPGTIEGMRSITQEAEQIAARFPEDVHGFMYHIALDRGMILSTHGDDHPAHNWRFGCYQDLLLEYGSAPRWAPLELPVEIPVMETQQCFYNAYCLTIENPDLTYHEGYAQFRFLPVQHAWVADPDGRIIDPTWAGLENIDGPAAYWGIPFATDFVCESALQTGWSSILNREWQVDYPALKRGFETNDAGLVVGYGGETA